MRIADLRGRPDALGFGAMRVPKDIIAQAMNHTVPHGEAKIENHDDPI